MKRMMMKLFVSVVSIVMVGGSLLVGSAAAMSVDVITLGPDASKAREFFLDAQPVADNFLNMGVFTVITTGEVEELSVELSLGSGLDLDFGERVTFSLVGIGLSAAQTPFFYESGESPFSVAVDIPVGEGMALVPLAVFISGLYGTFEPVIPFEIK
ncbi:MAG: hypothetical protein GY850_46210, partial [bacterium]|nr:hypothetical protein [bacterium]